MKIDFKKIIEINNLSELKKYKINQPIFMENYLFHYLIMFNKLDILKLVEFPIYHENEESLNGFHLAAKYNNIEILIYLIKTYPMFIYNKNKHDKYFIDYMKNPLLLLDIQLKWDVLISQILLNKICLENNYNDILLLLAKYKPKYAMNNLILNKNLSTNEIIKILDKLTIEELNLRDENDLNIIFNTITKKNSIILKYLIKRNIDIDYYTIYNTYSPLKTAILVGMEKIIWNKIKKNFNYEATNKNLETIAHFILNKNNNINLDNETIIDILINCSDDIWNQYDINKVTPLQLLITFDFNKYHYLIKNKSVQLTNINSTNKWYSFLKTLPKYKPDKNNIILKKYKYSHYNMFQSKFKDMIIYVLYLQNKYKNLYIPMINNSSFPWFINYENENEYIIHPKLNKLINNERRNKTYDFAFCYLSLVNADNGLHANAIIYDFNKMTVERFEPYGNTVKYDLELDNILKKELTLYNGFKYIKPSDYMPVAGFQTISDELNPYNQKSGDFGGYCLAWATWYLEHKIINNKVSNKKLIDKLIKKIPLLNISFMEYIRNYANKLNDHRVKILLQANIDEKDISNLNNDKETDFKLNNFLYKKFKSHPY